MFYCLYSSIKDDSGLHSNSFGQVTNICYSYKIDKYTYPEDDKIDRCDGYCYYDRFAFLHIEVQTERREKISLKLSKYFKQWLSDRSDNKLSLAVTKQLEKDNPGAIIKVSEHVVKGSFITYDKKPSNDTYVSNKYCE